MLVPKKYFHDKSLFFLTLSNGLLMVLTVLFVGLRVDTSQTAALISYRANLGINGFVSGSPTELYSFALFAALVSLTNFALSLRLFTFRRILSVWVLALNIVLLAFTLIVSAALIPVR